MAYFIFEVGSVPFLIKGYQPESLGICTLGLPCYNPEKRFTILSGSKEYWAPDADGDVGMQLHSSRPIAKYHAVRLKSKPVQLTMISPQLAPRVLP